MTEPAKPSSSRVLPGETNVAHFPQLIYPPPAQPEDDTIDLVELAQHLWHSRRLILAMTTAALLLSIGYLGYFQLLGKKLYEATVVYEPEYGDVGRFEKYLKTREFLTFFLNQENLTPIILADLYDPSDQTYSLPVDSLSPAEFAAIRLIGDKKNPNFELGNLGSGYLTLTVRYPDPQIATQLANSIPLVAASFLRQQMIEEAEKSLERSLLTFNNLGLTSRSLIVEASAREVPRWKLNGNVLAGLEERLVENEVRLRVLEQTNPNAEEIPNLRTEIEVVRERLPTWEERIDVSQANEPEPESIAGLRIQLAKSEAHLARLQDLDQPLLRLVDPAVLPEAPSNAPKSLLILTLSGIVGLFGSIFLVFLLDFITKVRREFQNRPSV